MNVVDPVTALFVVNVSAGVLIVAAGLWLMWERRPDDPGYTPRHAMTPARDDLERAVSGSWRDVTRNPIPWAAPRPHPSKRHSDETPLGDPVLDNLPDVVFKTFWTVVALALGYLTTVAAPDVGPTWTPLLAAVWTPVLVALRSWVDKRTSATA